MQLSFFLKYITILIIWKKKFQKAKKPYIIIKMSLFLSVEKNIEKLILFLELALSIFYIM